MAKGKRNRHAGATRAAPAVETKPRREADADEAADGGLPRGALLGLAALIAVSAVVAFALLGGGESDEGAGTTDTADLAVPWIDPDGTDPVVGAVDVNPADGSVWMSTNTGLFRVAEGSDEPEKVEGELETADGAGQISEQLVVRFTGDDELIASGHPPEGSRLPPALGLVRSTDAGKTWESVSELGKADFHAIQTSGETIVAGRYGEPAIDVSTDGGKTFSNKRPPDPLVDLAVDPDDPRRWVAATQSGVFTSSDQGGAWRQRDPVPNARLAWAEPSALFRIDPGGPVKRSADGGETWEDVGSTGGEPRALFAASADELYAVLLDGTVKQSTDGGATWTDRVTPPA
jgi:photosystem II stability/assembly factor-like uncharacterized protein